MSVWWSAQSARDLKVLGSNPAASFFREPAGQNLLCVGAFSKMKCEKLASTALSVKGLEKHSLGTGKRSRFKIIISNFFFLGIVVLTCVRLLTAILNSFCRHVGYVRGSRKIARCPD